MMKKIKKILSIGFMIGLVMLATTGCGKMTVEKLK